MVIKADHDLGTAKLIYLHLPNYFETIAFHCQQAVEKYLKAALIFNDIEYPYSHDLIYLLELLSIKVNIEPGIYKNALSLNEYSVKIGYPNKVIFLSKEELESAIKIAEFFRDFVMQQIGIEN